MVETTVDGNKYYSNEAKIETEKTRIVANNVKYVKHDENSPVTSLGNNQITYQDGILYIKGTATIAQYSSEVYPEVLNIINILDQMGTSDTISINGEVTALTLTSDNKKVTNYDLSKVPETATVTITGNSSFMTTVSGKLTNIIIKGVSANVDLSNLAVSGKVTVGANNENLCVAYNTTLTFGDGTSVKVNDVVITDTESKVRDIYVTENGFRFTGSENKLTVDASAAETKVNLEFVGTNQKGLEIISNDQDGVAILTNQQNINGLEIQTGKVDLSKAVFNSLTIGKKAGINKVTLITGKTSNEDARGTEITKTPKTLAWLGYNVIANKIDIATYDSDNGKNIISFNFNSNSLADDYVILSKLDSETLSSKKIDTKNITSSDSNLDTNLSAVKSVTVDKATNTITVDIDKSKEMNKYSVPTGGEHYWYAIIIDTGIPLESIQSGSRYDIDNGGELNYNKQLKQEGKIKDTEFLIYLSAEDPETIVSFIDSRTGDEHFYTVKVNNPKVDE